VRSGPAIARFFGTISPSTVCSPATIASATVNETACSTGTGTPSGASGPSSRCAITGSASAPSPRPHTVMPNWAPAISSGSSWPARSTVRALATPVAASASICSRRAVSMANSAPTKNALPASSSTVTGSASRVLMARPPPAGRARRPSSARPRW
jgi:hypothetical protein